MYEEAIPFKKCKEQTCRNNFERI